MFYNVLTAKKIIELGGKKFEKEILMQNNLSSLSILAIKKDEILDTHCAEENTAIYLLSGKIEIHFPAEKFILEKGEIIMFTKDKEHKILALKDSKFLLIKI